jgi:hypothetical protein
MSEEQVVTPTAVTTPPATEEKSGGNEGPKKGSLEEAAAAIEAAEAAQKAAPTRPKETAAEKSERSKSQMTALHLKQARDREAKLRQDATDAEQFREFLKLQKEDPEGFLKRIGIDKRKIVEEFVEQNKDKKPPTVDAKVTELETKLSDYEKRDQEREAADKLAQQKKFADNERASVKVLIEDPKHGDRFEGVNALKHWDTVHATAIDLAKQEGLWGQHLEPAEMEELFLRAADGVEQAIIDEEKKRPRLKKLAATQEATEKKVTKEPKEPGQRDNRALSRLSSIGRGAAPAPVPATAAVKKPTTEAARRAEFMKRNNLDPKGKPGELLAR